MLFIQSIIVSDECICVSTNNIELISYHVLFTLQHVACERWQGDVDRKKKYYNRFEIGGNRLNDKENRLEN